MPTVKTEKQHLPRITDAALFVSPIIAYMIFSD